MCQINKVIVLDVLNIKITLNPWISAPSVSKSKLFISNIKPLVVQIINLLESGRSLIRISPLMWHTELLGTLPSSEKLHQKQIINLLKRIYVYY